MAEWGRRKHVLEVEARQARRVDWLREKAARERVALAGLIQPLDADGEQRDEHGARLDEPHCLDARRRRGSCRRAAEFECFRGRRTQFFPLFGRLTV